MHSASTTIKFLPHLEIYVLGQQRINARKPAGFQADFWSCKIEMHMNIGCVNCIAQLQAKLDSDVASLKEQLENIKRDSQRKQEHLQSQVSVSAVQG